MGGIAVSAGSACSSGSMRPSHVLAAMGIAADEAAAVIRVSFGWPTTQADIDAFAALCGQDRRRRRASDGVTYLDYQASTPLAPEALEAMLPLAARRAMPTRIPPTARDGARRAAVEVGARARRCADAAWRTHGLHQRRDRGAEHGRSRARRGRSSRSRPSMPPCWIRSRRAVARVTKLPVGADGLVDLDAARAAIVPRHRSGVAAMLVNNEIGVLQPIAALADIAHGAGALLLCDAVQGYGRFAVPRHLRSRRGIRPQGLWSQGGGRAVGARRDCADAADAWRRAGGAARPVGARCRPCCAPASASRADLMRARHAADMPAVDRLWRLALERLGPEWTINGSADLRYRGNLNVRRAGLDVNRLMSDCRDPRLFRRVGLRQRVGGDRAMSCAPSA